MPERYNSQTILAVQRRRRDLVVVPSRARRHQLAGRIGRGDVRQLAPGNPDRVVPVANATFPVKLPLPFAIAFSLFALVVSRRSPEREADLRRPDVFVGRARFWSGRAKRIYLRYCSSLTFSSQLTGEPFSFSWIAMWLMAVVGVAPCQCFSPAAWDRLPPPSRRVRLIGGTSMDVGAWLRGLGLGQYEPAFRDNDIDARVLPALTADELKEIGVTSVGHRRLLLQAIAALSAPPAPAAPATAAVEAIAVPAAHAPSQAERRQLTVMFVDLVGSTALAARLDPEEMGELIRAYQNLVAGEVTRFEGHVAKYMGDGVLAYFGWPRAHEDDAERAVRAGRAIAATVPGLATLAGEPPAARIGIATGPAMVGDLIGSEEARERTVVGETPNLAARLQQLAEPGAVVIAEGTRRLVGDLFAYRSLAATRLKGFVEPLTVYHVLGEGAAEGRFEAMHTTGLTPLVGREQELALLLDRWERAKEGEGQVILLSGEAGIGKSRLVRALRERLESDPHTALGHFCSSYHASSALHPVIGLLEREAGLRREDLPKHQLDKLEAMLALAVEDVHTAASLLADLLAVPVSEGRYPPLAMSPQQKKERTFQALLDLLAGLAVREPVLALYEDVHWADPTTLELLGRVVDRAQRLSVLVLVTFRPEFVPPWAGHGHVTALSLSRLGRRQAATVVEQVAGDKVIPADVLDQILARTDGVPLFVEELTKTVLESGLLRDQGDHYELDGPLPPLAIPATLQDSLMARLDRLAPIKEVAQVGAAIGRQFSYELLAAVASLPDDRLQDALAQLAEVELVFRRGTPPQASYSFKHALVRDAAYASLLRSKRQQLHARIARALEERFPETVEAKPELLARHCTEAGLAEQAIDYWHRAGQRALARSAMAEAAAQLTKGLEVLAGLPDGPERRRRELGLQLVLGPALIAAKGVAAPGTGRTYARACELCRELGDVPELFPALYGRAVVHLQRGELAAALGVAHELLRLAEERGDAAARVTGYRMIGSALSQLGRPVESRDHLETALALYDPVRDRTSALVYALDFARGLPGVAVPRAPCSWLSRAGPGAKQRGARLCPRAGPSQHGGLCPLLRLHPPSAAAGPALCPSAGGSADRACDGAGLPGLAGGGHGRARLGTGARWARGGWHRGDPPWPGGLSGDGGGDVVALLPAPARRGAGTGWPSGGGLGPRGRGCGPSRTDRGTLDRGRAASATRRAAAGPPGARAARGGGLLPTSPGRGARAGCQAMGIARGDQSRSPLARPGRAAQGPRPARAGVRLVHRRFGHTGLAGRESAAR